MKSFKLLQFSRISAYRKQSVSESLRIESDHESDVIAHIFRQFSDAIFG